MNTVLWQYYAPLVLTPKFKASPQYSRVFTINSIGGGGRSSPAHKGEAKQSKSGEQSKEKFTQMQEIKPMLKLIDLVFSIMKSLVKISVWFDKVMKDNNIRWFF